MSKYRIIENLALLHDGSVEQLRLNVIQWDEQTPKYDLRLWKNTCPEGWIPGKGLIFSNSEARILCSALEKALFLTGCNEWNKKPVKEDTGEGPETAQNELLTDLAENPACN